MIERSLWYRSGRSKSHFTKTGASLEIDRLQVSLPLVRWDEHSGLCTMGHGSRHGIVLHLYTQKLLSESKPTKQEQLFIPIQFPLEHVFTFKILTYVSFACIHSYLYCFCITKQQPVLTSLAYQQPMDFGKMLFILLQYWFINSFSPAFFFFPFSIFYGQTVMLAASLFFSTVIVLWTF